MLISFVLLPPVYFLMRLISFLKDAVHFVRVSLAQSASSRVPFGLNFSFGVAALLLYSTHRSDEKPESLPKPANTPM
jgi:hypothetical protein